MRKGWALVTLFGGLSYLVEVAPSYAESRNKRFSLFYDAQSKERENRIVIADERTLIGHALLSPTTSFEDRDTVEAQWFPIIEGFCSNQGTSIERIRQH